MPAAKPSSGAHAQAAVVTDTYDDRTVQLHWITAGMVALLWGIAEVIDLFPRGAPRIAVRSVHIIVGLLLVAVVIRRLVWRCGQGRKLPAASSGGAWGHAASASHVMLYAVLLVVPFLGIVNAWARGDSIFSMFSIPRLLPDFPLMKPTVGRLHMIGANALVILALVHAAAALVHHYMLHDTVLQRMAIRRERR